MVRRARWDELPAILLLEKETPHAAHWFEEAYQAAFQPGAPDRIFLVSEENAELQGFVIARLSSAECELENIVVTPPHRRRGIGSRLLQAVISAASERTAKSILLEVRESNLQAAGFYSSLGFKESGRRKSYYRNPVEDAILYRLQI